MNLSQLARAGRISALALTIAAGAAMPALAADRNADATHKATEAPAASTSQAARERARILEEATSALGLTEKALRALESGKKQQSLDLLAKVIGKLEVITAAHPEMSLAPVSVQVLVTDYPGDAKAIGKAVDEAEDLLDDGKVQQARHLLASLASEVDIRVTNIPLATYPDAIRAIVPLIEQGKRKEAASRLQAALSTLVVVDHITPLPVLRAQKLLAEARGIAGNKSSMERKDEDKVGKLLARAKNELARARALGYLNDKEYKAMLKDARALERKISEHGDTRGLLDSLRRKVDDFLSRLEA